MFRATTLFVTASATAVSSVKKGKPTTKGLLRPLLVMILIIASLQTRDALSPSLSVTATVNGSFRNHTNPADELFRRVLAIHFA